MFSSTIKSIVKYIAITIFAALFWDIICYLIDYFEGGTWIKVLAIILIIRISCFIVMKIPATKGAFEFSELKGKYILIPWIAICGIFIKLSNMITQWKSSVTLSPFLQKTSILYILLFDVLAIIAVALAYAFKHWDEKLAGENREGSD